MSLLNEEKRKLYESYLTDAFNNTVDEAGKQNNNEDPIFNDIVGLCMWAEMEWKRLNANKILANPSHVCSPTCRKNKFMKRVDVSIFRTVRYLAGQFDVVDPSVRYTDEEILQKVYGSSAYGKMYHLCFPDTCDHLDPKHICGNIEMCPHKQRYMPADTRAFPFFWVCTDSGTVHICGDALCDQTKIISEKEGDVICPLTGTRLGNGVEQVHAFQNQLRINGEPMTPLMNKGGTGKKAAALTRDVLTMDIPPWQRLRDTTENYKEGKKLVMHLLFSHRRQMLEADDYLSKYESALEEMWKSLRAKKLVDDSGTSLQRFIEQLTLAQQRMCDETTPPDELFYHDKMHVSLVQVPYALAVLEYRMPASVYFSNIPMMTEIKSYIVRRRTEIINKYASGTWSTAASRARNAAIYQRREELMSSMIRHYRSAKGIEHPAPVTWGCEKWQTRMHNICDIFATIMLRVWTNINQHLAAPDDKLREVMAFKRMMLPLLYLTRQALCITEPSSTVLVEVVPYVDIALLLPAENQLAHFNIAHGKLTTLQNEIKQHLFAIARRGDLGLVMLRLSEVCQEINTRNNKNSNEDIHNGEAK